MVAAAVIASLMAGAMTVVAITIAMSVRVAVDTAADAAALAAVAAAVDGGSPTMAAAEIARRNDAELRSCWCPDYEGASFSATVVVGRAVEIPLLGVRWIWIERSAEYDVRSTVE